jgi:endonuclease V-like protein UPF0215 family
MKRTTDKTPSNQKGVAIHPHKKGIRALGIAESYMKGVSRNSVLVGVVKRADMIIDGFTISKATIGGMDSTQKILEMYLSLERKDINIMLLNGCVISWYNVVDLQHLGETTRLPIICVTYKDSEGLKKYFKEYFPENWQQRLKVYRRNGPRTVLQLDTHYSVYTRFFNLKKNEALQILNKFTPYGSIPEPLRVARLLARSIMKAQLKFGIPQGVRRGKNETV